MMERGVPRRRRPRPVAGVGLEAVLARGDDLAKGWLLALVEDVPLDQAAAILSGDVARDGPRICDALIRAVCDDADLRRIQRDGVLEPLVSRAGEIAGARTAQDAAHAVETLKDVVWSAGTEVNSGIGKRSNHDRSLSRPLDRGCLVNNFVQIELSDLQQVGAC